MQFGLCLSIEQAPLAKQAGFNYIEENAQTLLQPETPDSDWTGPARAQTSPLPIQALFVFIPGALKIIGPEVNQPRLDKYVQTALRRAHQLNIPLINFGSGVARQIPQGFDKSHATAQLVHFLQNTTKIAYDLGIQIAMEPLNKKECNFINNLAELLAIIQAVNHPALGAILDTYHYWTENDSLQNLAHIAPHVKHVHASDLQNRSFPGESQKSDYQPLFQILQKAGYAKHPNHKITIEASAPPKDFGLQSLHFLTQQWQSASPS